MFKRSSMERPKPFHNNNSAYYSISETAITEMVQSIAKEEKKLKEQALLSKKSKDHNNRKSLSKVNAVVSIDEDADTTQEIDDGDVQEDRDEEHPLEPQNIIIDTADCVKTPTVNLTFPQSNIEHTAEESMTNYKINREKYHFFCQNQAIKEEESRRLRKEKKVAHRKEAEPEEERRASKSKAWKSEAASTKRMLGSTPTTLPSLEHNSQEAATVITRPTILSMFQLSPTQTNSLVYQAASGEDPFFLAVFESIKTDMQTARIYKLRQTNLSKIRTFIVRRVLDDFVAQKFEDSPEQRQHLARHNRRITRVDRSRYLQAGIIEPPSRMKSHYLHQIFQNTHFRDYYIDYLASERLRLYMLATNQEMALKYWQEVLTIANRDEPYEQKIDLFREIKRKPLFLTQIVEYLEEATMIRIEYCKDKPKKNQ